MSLNYFRQGYSKERYMAPQIAYPIDVPGVAFDLTQAAATVGGQWSCPADWQQATIYSFGLFYSAAGGAQTIAAQMGININGAPVKDTGGNTFVVTSVSNHAKLASLRQFLNQNDQASGNTDSLISQPAFPVVNAGDILTWVVVTAGTGGVSQAGYPCIFWAPTPTYPAT